MKIFIQIVPNGNIQWQDYDDTWIGSPYCEQRIKLNDNTMSIL